MRTSELRMLTGCLPAGSRYTVTSTVNQLPTSSDEVQGAKGTVAPAASSKSRRPVPHHAGDVSRPTASPGRRTEAPKKGCSGIVEQYHSGALEVLRNCAWNITDSV